MEQIRLSSGGAVREDMMQHIIFRATAAPRRGAPLWRTATVWLFCAGWPADKKRPRVSEDGRLDAVGQDAGVIAFLFPLLSIGSLNSRRKSQSVWSVGFLLRQERGPGRVGGKHGAPDVLRRNGNGMHFMTEKRRRPPKRCAAARRTAFPCRAARRKTEGLRGS